MLEGMHLSIKEGGATHFVQANPMLPGKHLVLFRVSVVHLSRNANAKSGVSIGVALALRFKALFCNG